MYKFSLIISPEVVLNQKLDIYQPNELDATVEKYFRSLKPPVVAPGNSSENHDRGNQNEHSIIARKVRTIESALLQIWYYPY